MISNNTYEEVYQILKHMDKLSVMKIPDNILNKIVENRNPNYKTRIVKSDLFNQENISIEAKDFLCWLIYKFWMDEKEREEIDKINYNFYKKEDEEKIKKYDSGMLFKSRNELINDNEEKSLVVIEEKNIIKRIIDKIKNLFV